MSEATTSHPRVAMIVLNAVLNDSRVLKGAWYMSDKGWDVSIFGWSGKEVVDHFDVGNAHIFRFPRPKGIRIVSRYINYARKAWIISFGHFIPSPAAVTLLPITQARTAMTQALADYEPTILHAQDFSALPVALSAQRLIQSRTGRKVPIIYDAHEFLPGQANIVKAIRRSLISMERSAIQKIDSVVTVSPKIAEMLQANHKLPFLPIVVGNDPVLGASRPHASDIRKDIGLADSIPLMVYSGGVAPQRGIMDSVKSLPFLPNHHLAIMAPGENAHLKELLSVGESLGVRDRMHVLGFVANAEVTSYLRTADIGLIMNTHHVNHELSTPTKFSEYAHADIPIIASDVKFLAEETRRRGMGEVFISGDIQSFVEAVKKVTADPAKYKKAYTKEFLHEKSWEAQCEKLSPLYQELAHANPQPRAASEFKVGEREEKAAEQPVEDFYRQFLSA